MAVGENRRRYPLLHRAVMTSPMLSTIWLGENLKGVVISLSIGMLVYFLLIRPPSHGAPGR